MLAALALVALILAASYAVLTLVNLAVFRAPPKPRDDARPRVSLLIPARDEAANIDAAIAPALASEHVDLEVLVLDDGSTDDTAARVEAWAARDARVRLIRGREDLPPGWSGKQHACWGLSQAATGEVLVFMDADVRLEPAALARFAAALDQGDLGLASGFPREITRTLAETLVIPQIHVLLLGYLPIWLARRSLRPGYGAGCGQLMAFRSDAYAAVGGHATTRTSIHDGLALPRAFRAGGFRTDLFDASGLAACRMYANLAEVWHGFSKNATAGMATPGALPVWTLLLGGGHVLPFVLLPIALVAQATLALQLSALAVGAVWGARAALALRVRQSPLGVLLHPLGVCVVLAIQWTALVAARRGRRVEWRGRSYDAR